MLFRVKLDALFASGDLKLVGIWICCIESVDPGERALYFPLLLVMLLFLTDINPVALRLDIGLEF
jgi:hypothetical protein